MHAQSAHTPPNQFFAGGSRQILNPGRKFNKRLRRLVVRLAKALDKLPLQIYIKGVSLAERDPIGGGAFADVYKGVLNGQEVAVKKLRVFLYQTDEEKERNSKV